MKAYALVADEDHAGNRDGWRLLEGADGEDQAEVAAIGALTTTDARDWAALQITGSGDLEWRSADGSVFSSRWTAIVNDPWD